MGLPTEGELAKLAEAVRKNPAEGPFVELGEHLLSLGRPRDAIEVGARSLQASGGIIDPYTLRGRIMVAQAFCALHQWKEAQAELLKVVKADRSHSDGFRLLGEVLMRRSDYERALPVLQHAHNLSPADPAILALLRRARSGQPLDPPPPVPTPLMPTGGRPPSKDDFEDMPTHVANNDILERLSASPTGKALGRMELRSHEVHRSGPGLTERNVAVDRDDRHRVDVPAVEHHRPPPPENPLAPIDDAQPVRPRVLPTEKPKGAAQVFLRRSAAVGEDYLNHLLTSGLLDVPNVAVSEPKYDIRPDKKWGRSTRRMFAYLFVLLLSTGGGGGFWFWYTANQNRKEVNARVDNARRTVLHGDQGQLLAANAEIRTALSLDKKSSQTMAVIAEITALSHLLYGQYDPAEIERAISTAGDGIQHAGEVGYGELLIARAAITLATLANVGEDAESRLADVIADLTSYLETASEDRLARWLLGRAHLAAGDREQAIAAFELADGGGEGTALAALDLGFVALDQGDYGRALGDFERALKRAPNHPFAFVGRSLVRSERHIEASEAMADLSVGLAKAEGPRLLAYKELAAAYAHLARQDFGGLKASLAQTTGVNDPDFLARVGLLRLQLGHVVDAARARTAITWYAPNPQPHPLVGLLDGELYLARGLPREALAAVEGRSDLAALRLRGRASFELGDAAAALEAFEAARTIAPEDDTLEAWLQAVTLVSSEGEARRQADEALDTLGRQAKSKVARYVHGVALARVGERDSAREKLEQSLDGVTDEYPNPLAYHSHLALADLDRQSIDATLGEADPHRVQALKHLEAALEINPGFLPARDRMGQLLLSSNPEEAARHLSDVVDAGVASAGAELAFVRTLVPIAGAEGQEAVDAIRRAKEKGAAVELLQEAIALVGDSSLYRTLDVAEPAAKGKRPRRR